MFPYAKDYYICDAYGYMSSSLHPEYEEAIGMVTPVRVKYFKTICNIIKSRFPSHVSILDVGCAIGLFLKMAQDEGFNPVGVEPDFNFATHDHKDLK